MSDSHALVGRLTERFPQLQAVLDEHLADQEGELLSYVFMGEVAQWLEQHVHGDQRIAGDVLRWLESEFVQGDFDIRNLIDVGVMEMLPNMPEGAPVLPLLGPHLRERAEVAGLYLSARSTVGTDGAPDGPPAPTSAGGT